MYKFNSELSKHLADADTFVPEVSHFITCKFILMWYIGDCDSRILFIDEKNVLRFVQTKICT